MDEDDKLYYHFYGSIMGVYSNVGDDFNQFENLKKSVEISFPYYPGKTQKIIAPFNHEWMIKAEIFQKSGDIPDNWEGLVRQNTRRRDTAALSAMNGQRKAVFEKIVKPMAEEFICFVEGSKAMGSTKLDYALHSLSYSLCEAGITDLQSRISAALHIFFLGDHHSLNGDRKKHFASLHRLIDDWVTAFLEKEFSTTKIIGKWRKRWLGYEALAYCLYQLSKAKEKQTTDEAFAVMFPSLGEVPSLLEKFGTYFYGALKTEARRENNQNPRTPNVQLISLVPESQLELTVSHWEVVKGDVLTKSSLFSKITYMKIDYFRDTKQATENERYPEDGGCTTICRKYRLQIDRNIDQLDFLETSKGFLTSEHENVIYGISDKLNDMRSKCFCCMSGHGVQMQFEDVLKDFYCETSQGGKVTNCISPRYRHWGESYLYWVLKKLNLNPDKDLPEKQFFPLSVFLSPLPSGQGKNNTTREVMEQHLHYLLSVLADDENDGFFALHSNFLFASALCDLLKKTKLEQCPEIGV